MHARIIVLTKLPRRLDYFDYCVPKHFQSKIKAGHLVVVSFRNKKIYGICKQVLSSVSSISGLKEILELTDIVLPAKFVALLDWASERYLVSPAVFYKFALPKKTRQRSVDYSLPTKTLLLNFLQKENVLTALKNFNGSGFLYDNDFNETLAVFIKLSQKIITQNKQALVLVPAAQDIFQLAPYFQKIFGDSFIIWHGKLTAGKKWNAFLRVLRGDPLVVLGTRPAVFCPFKNLGIIFTYNHSSPDFKQWDQNPRYDAKVLAQKLCSLHQAEFIFSDTIFNLNSFYSKIPEINNFIANKEFSLVDLRKEKSLISYPVYELIKSALENKGRAVLFLNRASNDSILMCADCKNIFYCDICQRPYAIDKDAVLCYYCKTKHLITGDCPNCRGTNLKALRPGMANIKKEILKEFGNAKIAIASKKSKELESDWDVLIATDFFWKNILPKINKNEIVATAILDFDFYLIRPEFNQKEEAILAFHRFLSFAKGMNTLIQTSNPENDIFGPWKDAYKKELKERQEINYPPLCRLIKIICKEKEKERLEKETEKLYAFLQNKGFNPLPPYEPFIKKRTRNFLMHIILKEELKKDLSALREIIPDKYQIDIDPISIY